MAAADLCAERLRSLPASWSCGISRGGRVFFINEETKSTTWLHPLTGEAVITGHRRSPDLPAGWEEAYTFEGARYYINHNERKVTCKHPVTGQPSQDNCIFVVNEQTAATMSSEDKKDRPINMISEAAHYNLTSDYSVHPLSPLGRTSRSSKKVHNFGKRSNSIKRNPNAPVVRRGWLYKQDSTGMKLWKKRWFVLSDLCLFYYRDEKEEGILGSILLPSFQIAMLSSEDHINRKYAFKAAHPNMRTYYFCTDTAKEMELWMKAMIDAALVQTEPVKRADKITAENTLPREVNNITSHRMLIKPEAQNNQRNKEVSKMEDKKALEAEKYGFQKVGRDRPLTKINSVKQNSLGSEYGTLPASTFASGHYRPVHLNGSEKAVNLILADSGDGMHHNAIHSHIESERVIQRTNSMLQLEQWIKIQRGKGQEEETRGILSYQTLPRNMPSHRAQVLPRYPEGYRTLPRNTKTRPDSICSVTPSEYKTLGTLPPDDKRRSMRDDTMWQLYEWQQRQFYNKQTTLTRHGTLSSPKTMINIADQTMHMIPTSPSHGSIAGFQGYSPQRNYRSEVSSPVQRGDVTIDRRHRPHHNKQHVFVADRRSMPAGLSVQPISPQSLQGKTPEELTLLLIKLRRQQAELSSIREHTLAQLMQLKLEASSPKNEILSHHLQRNAIYLDHQLSQDECRSTLYKYRSEDLDIDAKLSRLCEQDKVVQALEEKLQQLHKEKYTLEQALLSASQEIEMNAENPAAIQNVILQRDDLQNGLLSTCREVSRATAELERAWREYDKLEYDVTVTKNHMQDQLERLGEVQTESAGIQRAQIQKELWRIQDVMEGLSKHKQQRNSTTEAGTVASKAFSSKYKNEEEEVVPPRPPLPRSYDFAEPPPIIPPLPSDSSSLLCYSRGPVHLPEERKTHQVQAYQRNGAHCGPDYRLYKSEPELTTVAEVDESNGEEKGEPVSESETSPTKGSHFPIGVVPPRTKSPTPESSTIASYVTLRKTKKIDLRTERPRSAVEQLCLAETVRPRMTVEEQMERIKRHQQACLREKKKGLNILGLSDLSPSQSPALVRENPFRLPQNPRKDDFMRATKELENAVKTNDLSPIHQNCADLPWLKDDDRAEERNAAQLPKSDDVLSSDGSASSKEENPNEATEKPKKLDGIQDYESSPKNEAPVVNHKPESSTEESEEASIQEPEDTISPFEMPAQTSRGNSTAGALPASAETIHG
ncbi:pleckstrin homology domain-containing family A member 5 isoform X3 [Sphaerodactylus townsendi]|uniref:pleckstrin homology domain-containing family A member 5 isoform X3 n=1 Tax=Sphaerodactylus townsendi TaxID=933632 RepID=UPI002025B712|nr:pleckstrin homology domain-containing family A member 5 isoform X3 [Sphaerodactylus townsendi]